MRPSQLFWTGLGCWAVWMCGACGGADADLLVTPSPPPSPLASTTEEPPAAVWAKDDYRKAVADAVEALLVADPVHASELGDHRFDDRWPDIGDAQEQQVAESFRNHLGVLRGLVGRVPSDVTDKEVSEVGTDHPALDAAILADYLEFEAYERTARRRMESDPSAVVELIGQGITSLTTHDYAPMQVRYAALAGRLAQVPELLKTARGRLKKATRAGFENLTIAEAGLARALRSEIAKPDLAALGNDQALVERLRTSAEGAAAALDAYTEDVKKTFPAKTLDATPIGAEAWATLARLKEGVIESPGAVRQMGEAEIERLTRELDDVMDASPRGMAISQHPHGPKDRGAFVRVMAAGTLPDDKILAQYRYVNRGVEAWLKTHRFATVPWDRAKLAIVQSPPQQRGFSLASMNEAGPLELAASDAHFEVNIPDPAMSAGQKDALRAFHTLGAIDLVSIHEALPGHYLQGLTQHDSPSRVRKIIWASTLGEGWAHYCEQAVLDAGYGGDDPERTRAFYIRMAMHRAVRMIVDVGENDGSLSFDDAAKLLEERALLPPEAARMEARRALVHPANMFSYTYGKLSILRMRQAVEARDKERFDLVRFHDRLLSVGAIPVRYVPKVAFGLD